MQIEFYSVYIRWKSFEKEVLYLIISILLFLYETEFTVMVLFLASKAVIIDFELFEQL